MSLDDQLRAIRLRCALSEMDHVCCLRVCGEPAFDLLDTLCPAHLYLRDGQMLHTLLLRPDGSPLVDVYICRDDEDFILLAEGLTGAELAEYLRDAAPAGQRPEIRDLSSTHRLLSIGGPWAWELLAELVGPGVVGLPYLTLYHEQGFTCLRAGKTGEYGYDLLVSSNRLQSLREQILELGKAFDLGEAGIEALDQCALENWFFNIRREGKAEGVTPLELQLQWRVSYDKDYPGAAALRERRARGRRRRLTCVVASEAIQAGEGVVASEAIEAGDGVVASEAIEAGEGVVASEAIQAGGGVVTSETIEAGGGVTSGRETVGVLVNAGHSSVRGDWVGLALLDPAWAHAGIDGLSVPRDDGSVSLRTLAPPVLDNRSLFIQPQKHSYRTRQEHRFPPLVPNRGR